MDDRCCRVRAPRQVWIDRSAVGLSLLCLLHCIFGAVLVGVLTMGGSIVMSHEVHAVGLMLAIPLAVVGLLRGIALHGRWQLGLLGGIGLCCMAGALLVAHGQSGEVLLTVTGVTLLALAHIANLRLARGC